MRLMPSRETHCSILPSFVWALFLHFGCLEMLFFLSSETHDSRVPIFVSVYFQPFGGPKMRSKPSRETHRWRVPSFFWAHSLPLGVLEMQFMQISEIHGSRLPLLVCSFSAFLRLENTLSTVSWKHTLQGYLASCESISYIWTAWKKRICRIVKPTVQGYLSL
jgi:hypothetical protein